jgi:hypothetical protein
VLHVRHRHGTISQGGVTVKIAAPPRCPATGGDYSRAIIAAASLSR